jgi:hypothetical protein
MTDWQPFRHFGRTYQMQRGLAGERRIAGVTSSALGLPSTGQRELSTLDAALIRRPGARQYSAPPLYAPPGARLGPQVDRAAQLAPKLFGTD